MAISLKHKFQSVKVDGTDSTKVRPSNWNAEHDLILATDMLIGRASAGSGPAEEVPCSAAARALLSRSSIADILDYLGVSPPTTGDFRLTLKTVAVSGWVMCDNGSIGDGLSDATTRANDDCEDLYRLIWDNISNTYAPVAGGRGPSAASDWAAHKRISLTKMLGRAICVAGQQDGGLSLPLGWAGGTHQETLTIGQIPLHRHMNTLNDPGHYHSPTSTFFVGATRSGKPSGGGSNVADDAYPTNIGIGYTGITITNAYEGGGQAHNNMQPSTAVNVMLKL